MKGVVKAHELMQGERFTPLPGGALKAGWTISVDLPPDAQICAVGMLRNMPVLWEQHAVIEVETGFAWDDVPYHVLVVVDGYPHEGIEGSTYIGTIFGAQGADRAWHVFTYEPRDGGIPTRASVKPAAVPQ
jgi:hypothetical protein